MDGPDRSVIHRYAAGDITLRDYAIRIYRINLRVYGLNRGDAHYDFMSETDTPVPDLALRHAHRLRVLKAHNNV